MNLEIVPIVRALHKVDRQVHVFAALCFVRRQQFMVRVSSNNCLTRRAQRSSGGSVLTCAKARNQSTN